MGGARLVATRRIIVVNALLEINSKKKGVKLGIVKERTL